VPCQPKPILGADSPSTSARERQPGSRPRIRRRHGHRVGTKVTHGRREKASNPRFLSRNGKPERSADRSRRHLLLQGPRVRISLPPAASHERTGEQRVLLDHRDHNLLRGLAGFEGAVAGARFHPASFRRRNRCYLAARNCAEGRASETESEAFQMSEMRESGFLPMAVTRCGDLDSDPFAAISLLQRHAPWGRNL
jgi:hypothetical protein